MRKGIYETIAKCHEKLLHVDFDPDSLNPDEINKISKLTQEISKRAVELRERAQSVHGNAEIELKALQEVVNEFLTFGRYNQKTFHGIISILVIDPGFVSEDRIKRIKELHGLPLLLVLLGMERTSLGKMRQYPFDNLMSLICEITIDENIPAYARELDEFLRMPDKTYLDIKSEIERYAANRDNDSNLALIDTQHANAAGPFSLKRKRREEGTENSKEEIDQPGGFLEAAFSIRKEQYLRVIEKYGGDGLLGYSSNTEMNATILVPIPRTEAKLLPKSLRLLPAPSRLPSASTQTGPIFFADTRQSSVS